MTINAEQAVRAGQIGDVLFLVQVRLKSRVGFFCQNVKKHAHFKINMLKIF